ncbi:MAG TPA: TMEM175 family protein [Solirubrobacterales bacterium]|nr:TMEM175 family protein [Solirubrobacterales bacterium]
MSREREAKRREGNEIEFSRIVAFSDGVFAIAITLLVLSLDIPEQLHGESLGSALWDQRQDLLAYAISFAVIGRFWVIHHRFFGDVTGFDGRLLALNILYLAWIVLIPFSSEVLGDHGGDTDAIVLYAVNLAAVALLGWVMAFDAHRAGLTAMGAAEEREFRLRACFVALVFLASIPIAFLTPDLAPLVWLVLFLDPTRGLMRRFTSGAGS